jgi:hypothetical protein
MRKHAINVCIKPELYKKVAMKTLNNVQMLCGKAVHRNIAGLIVQTSNMSLHLFDFICTLRLNDSPLPLATIDDINSRTISELQNSQ